jgi:hypothetical protein
MGTATAVAGDAYQRYFTVAVPVGYQIEHSGVGPQAPLLELTEDPAGSGLAIGRALGRLDPAYYNDTSDLDVWRIKLEKDDRVSISVDSPASTLYPSMWLYDPAGTQVASDEYRSYYGLQGYGPDYDAFISNYQVQSTGTYLLVVARAYPYDYRGAYELHVERARGIQQEYDLNYANDSHRWCEPADAGGCGNAPHGDGRRERSWRPRAATPTRTSTTSASSTPATSSS